MGSGYGAVSSPATAGAHRPPASSLSILCTKVGSHPKPTNHGVYKQPQTLSHYYTLISFIPLLPSNAFPTRSNGLKMPFLPRERKAGSNSDLCANHHQRLTSNLGLHVSERGKENGTFFSLLMQRAAQDCTAQKQLSAVEAKGSEDSTPYSFLQRQCCTGVNFVKSFA